MDRNGESGIKFPEKGTYTLTYGKVIELTTDQPYHRHGWKKVELSDGKEVTVSSKMRNLSTIYQRLNHYKKH